MLADGHFACLDDCVVSFVLGFRCFATSDAETITCILRLLLSHAQHRRYDQIESMIGRLASDGIVFQVDRQNSKLIVRLIDTLLDLLLVTNNSFSVSLMIGVCVLFAESIDTARLEAVLSKVFFIIGCKFELDHSHYRLLYKNQFVQLIDRVKGVSRSVLIESILCCGAQSAAIRLVLSEVLPLLCSVDLLAVSESLSFKCSKSVNSSQLQMYFECLFLCNSETRQALLLFDLIQRLLYPSDLCLVLCTYLQQQQQQGQDSGQDLRRLINGVCSGMSRSISLKWRELEEHCQGLLRLVGVVVSFEELSSASIQSMFALLSSQLLSPKTTIFQTSLVVDWVADHVVRFKSSRPFVLFLDLWKQLCSRIFCSSKGSTKTGPSSASSTAHVNAILLRTLVHAWSKDVGLLFQKPLLYCIDIGHPEVYLDCAQPFLLSLQSLWTSLPVVSDTFEIYVRLSVLIKCKLGKSDAVFASFMTGDLWDLLLDVFAKCIIHMTTHRLGGTWSSVLQEYSPNSTWIRMDATGKTASLCWTLYLLILKYDRSPSDLIKCHSDVLLTAAFQQLVDCHWNGSPLLMSSLLKLHEFVTEDSTNILHLFSTGLQLMKKLCSDSVFSTSWTLIWKFSERNLQDIGSGQSSGEFISRIWKMADVANAPVALIRRLVSVTMDRAEFVSLDMMGTAARILEIRSATDVDLLDHLILKHVSSIQALLDSISTVFMEAALVLDSSAVDRLLTRLVSAVMAMLPSNGRLSLQSIPLLSALIRSLSISGIVAFLIPFLEHIHNQMLIGDLFCIDMLFAVMQVIVTSSSVCAAIASNHAFVLFQVLSLLLLHEYELDVFDSSSSSLSSTECDLKSVSPDIPNEVSVRFIKINVPETISCAWIFAKVIEQLRSASVDVSICMSHLKEGLFLHQVMDHLAL